VLQRFRKVWRSGEHMLSKWGRRSGGNAEGSERALFGEEKSGVWFIWIMPRKERFGARLISSEKRAA